MPDLVRQGTQGVQILWTWTRVLGAPRSAKHFQGRSEGRGITGSRMESRHGGSLRMGSLRRLTPVPKGLAECQTKLALP